ncbi:MAG: hypothetical protein WB801_00890, partial [Candidatus Dormiibacterota bacterium]
AWAQSQLVGAKPALTALRAVVDTPTTPLGLAATLVEPQAAAASPLMIARLLLLRPASLRQLGQLRRRQKLALASLGQAVAVAVLVLGGERAPGERPVASPAASSQSG